MPDITPVIKTIVAGLLAGGRPQMTSASKMEWALLAFIVLCVSVDVFLLAFALYQYLTSLFPAPAAALICAAAFLAAALLAVLLRKLITSEKTRGPTSAEDELKEKIHILIAGLFNELEEPIRENPKTSMAVAALAGLLTARRI